MITDNEKKQLSAYLPKKYAKIIMERLIDDDVVNPYNGEHYTRKDISNVYTGKTEENIVIEKYLFELANEYKQLMQERDLARRKLIKA